MDFTDLDTELSLINHRVKRLGWNSSSDQPKVEQTILSIDIGVQHLSLVLSTSSEGCIHIRSIDLVDITQYTHTRCSTQECTLHHTKTFYDWLRHVVQEYNHLFEQADTILIERQPPMGFVVVEQILFGFYRDKSVLVSPNSVHAFHRFQGLDYEQRKVASEILSLPYLSVELRERIKSFDRAHDVTDAILQLLYYLNKNAVGTTLVEDNPTKVVPTVPCSNLEQSLNYLEQFRYKKI